MDERANFAISELTAGIASGVTSLTLSDASLFPTPDIGYNAVLWDSSVYGNPAKDANVEIVRVTGKSTNTLTITRAQESTADVDHNTGGHTYSLAISLTEKTLDDIETLIAGKADALGGDENYVTDDEKSALHAAGGDTALGTQAENLDMGTHKIVGVVDPTEDQEAATKKYVDDNEPTLPVKATGAEIDTGTDDAKFATAKALKDSHNVPSVAPSTDGKVMTSNGTDWVSETPAGDSTKLPLTGGTMTGDIQLGETDIKLDAVLSGDEKWSGITVAGTAGATLAVGDVCFLQTADSKWELVDGILDGTDLGFKLQLGICVLAANADAATEMLVYGKVRSAAFPALTVGAPVYLDDTAGDLVCTQPSTTNFAIRVVGYAITAEDLMFCPSNDYIVYK